VQLNYPLGSYLDDSEVHFSLPSIADNSLLRGGLQAHKGRLDDFGLLPIGRVDSVPLKLDIAGTAGARFSLAKGANLIAVEEFNGPLPKYR